MRVLRSGSSLLATASEPSSSVGSSRRELGERNVKSNPRDRGGQPPSQVVDLSRVGPAKPKPGFLNSVFGLSS